jgi:hypothetical protein
MDIKAAVSEKFQSITDIIFLPTSSPPLPMIWLKRLRRLSWFFILKIWDPYVNDNSTFYLIRVSPGRWDVLNSRLCSHMFTKFILTCWPYHLGSPEFQTKSQHNKNTWFTTYKSLLHKSIYSQYKCSHDSDFTSLGVSTMGCSAAFTAGTPVWTMGTTRSPDGGGSDCNTITHIFWGTLHHMWDMSCLLIIHTEILLYFESTQLDLCQGIWLTT